MKKPSEVFEGPNSSLRKTFDEAVQPRTDEEREEAKLAIFVDFVEQEANRIDEERRGLRRKDGGRKMQCLLFMRQFLTNLLAEKNIEISEAYAQGWNEGQQALKGEGLPRTRRVT